MLPRGMPEITSRSLDLTPWNTTLWTLPAKKSDPFVSGACYANVQQFLQFPQMQYHLQVSDLQQTLPEETPHENKVT